MTTRKSPNTAQNETSEIDVSSMEAIRSLLHEQPPERAVPETTPEPHNTRFAPLPDEHDEDQANPSKKKHTGRFKFKKTVKQVSQDSEAGLASRIIGHRHAPKAILIVSALLIIYFRPWLILGILMITGFLLAGVFLILGYDGFWRRTMGVARWYARRRPARAVELHRKLDGFAMKWDAILDRFPEGTVDGLYLPDFGEIEQAEVRHDAALDRRFTQMRQTKG